MSSSENDDEDEKSAPDFSQLFQAGQYFPAKVQQVFPTASQSFISQYPMTETTRLAARVELTFIPEKVNSEVAKADLGKGYVLTGEIKSEEDKGWRVGLGLNAEEGMSGVEGWIGKDDVERITPGTSPDLTGSDLCHS